MHIIFLWSAPILSYSMLTKLVYGVIKELPFLIYDGFYVMCHKLKFLFRCLIQELLVLLTVFSSNCPMRACAAKLN